jgi:ATP-binding cassette, subfamily B, bacterial
MKKKEGLLRRFAAYYKPYIGWFVLDMAAAATASLLSIFAPYFVRKVLAVIQGGETTVSPLIVTYLAIVLSIYVLSAVCTHIRIKWGHYLGVWIENDMRRDMFHHLQKLSFSYFDRNRTGDIMSRISNDLFNIAEVAHHCPEDMVISLLTIIGAYILMFMMCPPLAFVSIIPLPLMAAYGIVFNRRLKKSNRAIRKRISEINVTAENSIQGIREVKSYSREELQEEKFKQSNINLKESREDMYREMAAYQSGISFMRQFYYFITIAGGILLIVKGRVTVADLTAFILYVSVVLPPIDRLINFTEQFTQGVSSFERFTEIMDVMPQINDRPDARDLVVTKGDIEFRDVSFKYEGEDEKVLDHFSMKIDGGKRIAIVGESGAGKTTAVSLLARFYEKDGGTIAIDGTDVDSVTQRSLRNAIGFVQQDVFLFDASIRENLSYGRPGATDEEIWDAVRKAHLEDFVMSLPDGLDTEVGERGTRLSGGQKQRLSIARVFLKNPPILIFDEATSSLDTESETLIQDAFNRLAVGRTSIVIAHRLSTIIDSDEIYVIDKGKVVEKGTHTELLEKKGLYYRLYSLK